MVKIGSRTSRSTRPVGWSRSRPAEQYSSRGIDRVCGGSILLLQSTPFYTNEETKTKPFALLVSLSVATGSAIINDGISLSKSSLDVVFAASKGSI